VRKGQDKDQTIYLFTSLPKANENFIFTVRLSGGVCWCAHTQEKVGGANLSLDFQDWVEGSLTSEDR
jgi:hypothetical protein